MVDRKYVDFNKNEVDKMAKWTVNNEIYYVSIESPDKSLGISGFCGRARRAHPTACCWGSIHATGTPLSLHRSSPWFHTIELETPWCR